MMEIVCGNNICYMDENEVGLVCELFEYIKNMREDYPNDAIQISIEYVEDFRRFFDKLKKEIIADKIEMNEAYRYLLMNIDVKKGNMCEQIIKKDMIECLKYLINVVVEIFASISLEQCNFYLFGKK